MFGGTSQFFFFFFWGGGGGVKNPLQRVNGNAVTIYLIITNANTNATSTQGRSANSSPSSWYRGA